MRISIVGMFVKDLEGAKQFNWAAVLVPFGIVALAGAGIGAAVFYRRRSEAEETGGDDQ